MSTSADPPLDADDGYTGAVGEGGIGIRRLPGVTIAKLSVGPMDNNCYIVTCTTSGHAILIDAAAESARILDAASGTDVRYIVTTHRHADHWQALEQVAEATGARTVVHHLDAPAIPYRTDTQVRHGDRVRAGGIVLEVIHLRGHTPGSIALRLDGPDRIHLWTGDSLFPGGPGNTFGDAAAFTSLMDDLESRVFAAMPDDTWFYPGHGDDSTLGEERPEVPQWRARGW